jgi:hypothetical protein
VEEEVEEVTLVVAVLVEASVALVAEAVVVVVQVEAGKYQ